MWLAPWLTWNALSWMSVSSEDDKPQKRYYLTSCQENNYLVVWLNCFCFIWLGLVWSWDCVLLCNPGWWDLLEHWDYRQRAITNPTRPYHPSPSNFPLLNSNVEVFCKYVSHTVWLSFETDCSLMMSSNTLKLHRFTKQNCFYLINLNLSHPLFKYPTVPALCLAIYASAQAAASLTPGSKSSRHITSESRAPQSTVACASCGECLPTARSTKAAAFL